MHSTPIPATVSQPGQGLDVKTMPGHWFLARMGKTILRPGGRKLTAAMLDALEITGDDDVVELAPGLGITTRLVLDKHPASYTAVERDPDAVKVIEAILPMHAACCRKANAAKTGLPDKMASVVFGEAFLTMQTDTQKQAILGEAFRLLRPGGRYGFHEIGLRPDSLDGAAQEHIRTDLRNSIRVGARPLTTADWRTRIEEAGFRITAVKRDPMHLLGPRRIIEDEGVGGFARIAWNTLRTRGAPSRAKELAATFRRHAHHIEALVIVAEKPGTRHP